MNSALNPELQKSIKELLEAEKKFLLSMYEKPELEKEGIAGGSRIIGRKTKKINGNRNGKRTTKSNRSKRNS
jgi:hypothetical protein